MKKICEIYDVSKDYDLQAHSLFIIVSDLDKPNLLKVFHSFEDQFPSLMTNHDWQQFIYVNKNYNRNESKHQMREKRNPVRAETQFDFSYEDDPVSKVLENRELTDKIEQALSTLKEPAKSRFLKYYADHLPYREIASEEGKAVSTIYESIMTARKKFLKYF